MVGAGKLDEAVACTITSLVGAESSSLPTVTVLAGGTIVSMETMVPGISVG